MQESVYRVLTLLCAVVSGVPIGTNLGLVGLLWTRVSGRLLGTRGAVIPGLSAAGLSPPAGRRAWAALGQGHWTSAALLATWRAIMTAEGHWQVHTQEGYHAVAGDVTGFWRPRLRGCPTTHYDGRAAKALPAIPVGIIARVGSVGGQRLGLPLALVRADPTDARARTSARCCGRRCGWPGRTTQSWWMRAWACALGRRRGRPRMWPGGPRTSPRAGRRCPRGRGGGDRRGGGRWCAPWRGPTGGVSCPRRRPIR